MIERKDGVVVVSLSALDIAWAKRLVRQDQEHQSRLAADPRLTEEEAVWVARDPGVSLYELPASELGLLANRWLDEGWELRLFERVWQTSGIDESRREMFAEARLEMLECVLGTQVFSAAITEREAAWQRRFKEAEEAERNLPPCLVCGEPRKFVSVSSRDDRICDACEYKVWQAAFGSCVSCGGEREVVGSAYTGGRCQDCATRELGPCRQCGGARTLSSRDSDGGLCPKCLDQQFGPCADCGRQLTSWVAKFGQDLCCGCAMQRREQEPCPKCGGHRDPHGSAHTGDLCWQCAEEQQPPCARCGTRLRLARDKGDICWPCRVNRHFHLPERPSGMNTP